MLLIPVCYQSQVLNDVIGSCSFYIFISYSRVLSNSSWWYSPASLNSSPALSPEQFVLPKYFGVCGPSLESG